MELSVIIPCYNDHATLGRAIASVQAQTGVSKEIIVVDDGSADGLEEQGTYGPNVRIIKTDHCGCSKARNCGLAAAEGEYVAFLDADDCLVKDESIYSDTIHIMQKNDYDIVSGDYIRQDMDSGERTLVRSLLNGEVPLTMDNDLKAFFLPGSICYVWNKVYRKSFLRNNHIEFGDFSHAEDRDFNARCIEKHPKIWFSDRVFIEYHFRRKPVKTIFKDFLGQARHIYEAAEKNPVAEERQIAEYRAAYTAVFGLYFGCQGRRAYECRQICKSALTDTFFKKAVRILSVYPAGAEESGAVRRGIRLTAKLLAKGHSGMVGRIFYLTEKFGEAGRLSPAGLMGRSARLRGGEADR